MTYEQLYGEIKRKGTCLCIGLDSDPSKFPEHIKQMPESIFEFNKAIIDATAPYCVAYKPNTAFYEAEGASGWAQLEKTVRYIREKHPEMFIIADVKRGDIGNTAARYAKAFFETMDFDAVTLSPYMGRDSIDPFLKYEGRWVIVLALTSNKSADDFETLDIVRRSASGIAPSQVAIPLYQTVMEEMMNIIPDSKNEIMFVVGATRAEKLAEIRQFCPDHFLLVPGVGAQGGSMKEVVKYGQNPHCGLLVNSSRGIIFASHDPDFAQRAAEEAAKLRF